MDEKITLDQLASALARASTICAPDEYQRRQNELAKITASYLLNEYYDNMEANDE